MQSDMPPKIDPRPGAGTDPGPAAGLRPGREGRRRPPERTGRHDHRAARLPAGDAAEADLQLRPADRRERQAGAAARPTWRRWPTAAARRSSSRSGSSRWRCWRRRWSRTARCSTTARSRRPSGRRSSTGSRTTRTSHVLLMSYGTGSVGLNLQFTNYVFLFDRWWNPAVEDQAINRAHRHRPEAPGTVTRFLTRGHDRGADRRDPGGEAEGVQRPAGAERTSRRRWG